MDTWGLCMSSLLVLQFEEFCRGIATLVGAESTADSVTLLQSVEQLTQVSQQVT